jgi:hypothetical protein
MRGVGRGGKSNMAFLFAVATAVHSREEVGFVSVERKPEEIEFWLDEYEDTEFFIDTYQEPTPIVFDTMPDNDPNPYRPSRGSKRKRSHRGMGW